MVLVSNPGGSGQNRKGKGKKKALCIEQKDLFEKTSHTILSSHYYQYSTYCKKVDLAEAVKAAADKAESSQFSNSFESIVNKYYSLK